MKTLLIIIFFCSTTLYAQTKDEHEVRVLLKDFPEKAITTINALPKAIKKLKLYKETDSVKVSYEAKFKYKKKRYSLEFNKDGAIEDLEVVIKKKHLSTSLYKTLKAFFKTRYKAFNYIKIQKQYLPNGPDKDFVNAVFENALPTVVNYEIIAEVKDTTKREIREFLFNANGNLLRSRPLKPSSYEHIMY